MLARISPRVEVVHSVPGRLRLRVPALESQPDLAERILSAGMAYPGVRSVRVNLWCASVAVEYQPGEIQGIAPHDLVLRWLNERPAQATAHKDGVKRFRFHRFLPLGLALGGLALAFLGGATPVPALMTLAGALPIFKRAVTALLREHRLNVDQLDMAALGTMIAMGDVRSAALMSALVAVGEEIREHTARRSLRAALDLKALLGQTAWLVRGQERIRVSLEELRIGDVVTIYPGDLIPVDGIVISGLATVDQKTLTGEAHPLSKSPGDHVFAATVVSDGKLYVRAEAVGGSTRAGSIVRTLEQAPVFDTRAARDVIRLADQLVGPTFALAGLTYALTGNPARGAAILVVDLATGLRVATPTAVLASMVRAAQEGILIKSGYALEQLAAVDAIVFDKTGTLTRGEPSVSHVAIFNEHFPPEMMLGLAAASEIRLRHPTARALVRYAREHGIPIPARKESHYTTGLGVRATVKDHTVHVGSARFLESCGIVAGAGDVLAEQYGAWGSSVVYVAVDEKLTGIIGYNDPPRSESASVIGWLRRHGVKEVLLVSGDEPAPAQAVAQALDIGSVYASALPDEKAAIVRTLRERGHIVAVVGDGINDSPALAHANVSISLAHGSEVARETADVVLMEPDLWGIAKAIMLARTSKDIVDQNLRLIALANAGALALALPGIISPLGTAILNNGSTIVAALNSLRPLRWAGHRNGHVAPAVE